MKFNLNTPAPRCPLCGEFMETLFNRERQCLVFACRVDRVKIRVDDPFVGRWDEALHKSTDGAGILCPQPGCGTKMRYFATSVGYMKALCPKKGCGATLTSSEPDRKTDTPDQFYAPENPGVLQ